MTDPTGRTFVSYRRKPVRSTEVGMIVRALHDYGVPTWRDITDLESGPTSEELRRVIRDPQTAAALLWLTPEVEDSDTIRKIELPEITARYQRRDAFFVRPILAGGLDYDQVSDVTGVHIGLDNLQRWDLEKAQGDPIDEAEAVRIGRLVLRRRLKEIVRTLPPEEPLKLNLSTREDAPFIQGTALSFDWGERFEGRIACESTWNDHLLPALKAASTEVRGVASGRQVEAGGLCTLPAAMALGAAFLAPMGTEIGWRQRNRSRADQVWSLRAERETADIEIRSFEGDVSSDDLAVIVTIGHDVEETIANNRKEMPKFRGHVRVTGPDGEPMDLATPGQAVDAAQRTIAAVNDARKQWRSIRRVHFFLAIPAGYAFLLGQLINGLGPVYTYEHVPSDAIGVYRRAALLHPGA